MNTDTIIVAAIAAIGGVLGGSGAQEAIRAFTGRRPKNVVQVDNEVKLAQEAANQAKAAAAYAQQMQESARQAWAQTAAAEQRTTEVSRAAQERVDGMERTVDEVERRLSIVSRYTVWLLRLIDEPDMTMEGMRSNVRKHRPPVAVGEGAEG